MALRLKDNKIFEGIDGVFLNLVIDNSERVQIKSGEYIVNQGATDDHHAYIIQIGEVGVIIDGVQIKNLGEGDIFGEISLITEEPRTASIKALSDLILLKINKKILEKIIRELKNGKEIQKVIFDRIIENNKR